MAFVWSGLGSSAQEGGKTESRIALVIGNGDYPNSPLRNPPNDAADIAAALRAVGFELSQLVNGDFAAMNRAIRDFGNAIKGADRIRKVSLSTGQTSTLAGLSGRVYSDGEYLYVGWSIVDPATGSVTANLGFNDNIESRFISVGSGRYYSVVGDGGYSSTNGGSTQMIQLMLPEKTSTGYASALYDIEPAYHPLRLCKVGNDLYAIVTPSSLNSLDVYGVVRLGAPRRARS